MNAYFNHCDRSFIIIVRCLDSNSRRPLTGPQAAAETAAQLAPSGLVFQPETGLYYDHDSGYYWDPSAQMYYDGTTGYYLRSDTIMAAAGLV